MIAVKRAFRHGAHVDGVMPKAHTMAKTVRRRWGYLLLLLALVVPAVLPLLQAGFFVSLDGRFHVYRTAALAQAWLQGVLHPRLFPEFGFGYGQAVLNYYSPLSYWPNAALTMLGAGPAAAVEVTIALGFILAALAMYGYVRYLWGPAAGLVAAIIYTYFPYHLADAYVRGAVPEHAALVLLPLVAWAYSAGFREEKACTQFLWGGLCWAGLVYTHSLTALIFAPVIAAYVLTMAAWTRRWRRLVGAAGSLGLGTCLSSAYWFPMALESKAVGIGLGPSRGYENHFLSLRTALSSAFVYDYGQHTEAGGVYPFSWLTIGLLILAAVLLIWRSRRSKRPMAWPIVVFYLALAVVAGLMMCSASAGIWESLKPVLGHLQYPWRFMVLAGLAVAVLAGASVTLLPGVRPAPWIAVLTVLATITALVGLPLQRLDMPDDEVWSPERMWQEDALAGQVGATWTGEFLPVTVREQRWALSRPDEAAPDHPVEAAELTARLSELGYERAVVAIETLEPTSASLHQFYLPAWRAWVNGRPAATYPKGPLALLTVDVPVGQSSVVFQFGPTVAWWMSRVLVAASVIALIFLAVWPRLAVGRPMQALVIALAIVALALVVNGLGVGRRISTPQAAQVQFANVAVLSGFDVSSARGGDGLDVTLYWAARHDMDADLQVFVHLLDERGEIVAQHDGTPVGGFTPTSRWMAGEIIADGHIIELPQGLPAGEYRLKAGLYSLNPLRNLPTMPASSDQRADLGRVLLRPARAGRWEVQILDG